MRQFRSLVQFALFTSLPFVAAPIAAQTFADGSFAGWSSQVFLAGASTSGLTINTSLGGPQPSLEITNSPGPGGMAFLAAWSSSHTWDPSSRGPIVRVSMAIEFQSGAGAFGDGQSVSILAVQGGRFFGSPAKNTGVSATWTNVAAVAAEASDFIEYLDPFSQDPNSQPDFSATGAPIAFGILAGNSSAGGGYSLTNAYDNWSVTLVSCQPDLGFQGPGSPAATLCGTGLAAGASSDYEVLGAEPNAAGAFLVSLPNLANVTLFPATANPGTLVSGTGLAGAFPVVADGSGNLSFTVPGLGTVADLVFQSIFVDITVPEHNVAFTNAVLARFGQ